MKSFKVIAVLMALSLVNLLAQNSEELFSQKCAICHTTTKPTPEARSSFVAPPVMGVMFHVKEAFGGDKQKVIAFIKDYVLEPSEKKAKCLPKSIKRFGLMPSQKGNVTEEELEKIAEYMYENFPQRGFEPKQQRY